MTKKEVVDMLEYYTDLERLDLDVEVFGSALAVQHLRSLLVNGGSRWSRYDSGVVLAPHHLRVFLTHAVEAAQQTRRFEQEWHQLLSLLPEIEIVWEKGQAVFREDLARALVRQEEMEYLPHADLAHDCYAYVSARNTYPRSALLPAWFMNGYMVAWRRHFLKDEEDEEDEVVTQTLLLE